MFIQTLRKKIDFIMYTAMLAMIVGLSKNKLWTKTKWKNKS